MAMPGHYGPGHLKMSFQRCDKDGSGYIPKDKLLQVLRCTGRGMTDAEFNCLLSSLGFKSTEEINYMDFLDLVFADTSHPHQGALDHGAPEIELVEKPKTPKAKEDAPPSDARRKKLEAMEVADVKQIKSRSIATLVYAVNAVSASKQITVNDVFHMARLPARMVLDDGGMTLAQTFNIASDVVAALGGLFVEAYHFDADLVDYDGFTATLVDQSKRLDDILVVNCDCGALASLGRSISGISGNHYSLISHAEKAASSDDITVTLTDVNFTDDDRSWTCSARSLFEALCLTDSSSQRARGLLRVGWASSASRRCRPLLKAQKSVCYCDPWLGTAMSNWLGRFAALPTDKFQTVLGAGGYNAIALAVSGLSRRIMEPEEVMRALKVDFLARVAQVESIDELERGLKEIAKEMSAAAVSVGDDADALLSVFTENAGFTSQGRSDCVAVALIDINTAMGASVFAVDASSGVCARWVVVAHVDAEKRELIVADPNASVTTRLWRVSAEDMLAALQAAKSEKIIGVHSSLAPSMATARQPFH